MERLDENFVNLYKRWRIGDERIEDKAKILDFIHSFRNDDEFTIDENGLINCNGNVIIKNEHIVDGKIPFKFGKVFGDFSYMPSDYTLLTSLENSPDFVGKSFTIHGSRNLKTLKYFPKDVNSFLLYSCILLKDLSGININTVKGDVVVINCSNITSLKGCPEIIGGNFNLHQMLNVKKLDYFPKEINKLFIDKKLYNRFGGVNIKKVCNIKGEITLWLK